MAGTDSSTRRVITVIALMILAALALRGHLPGAPRTEPREPPAPDNPLALFAVIALVCAAVAIIAFAVLTRLRDRRPRGPSGGEIRRRVSGDSDRPTWRFTLIALALIVGWLALVVVLMQIDGPEVLDEPAPAADPPAAEAPNDPVDPPTPPEPDPGTDVVGYLVPPMLLLMAVVVAGTAVASARQRRRSPDQFVVDTDDGIGVPAPAAADTLARAAEVGLAEIGDLSREPREAIIACYAAMERELTRVPGAVPQDFDTPSEVLARAVARNALRADSATELVELFEEARFSPHVMTEVHRDAAVRVLERVLAELPDRSAT